MEPEAMHANGSDDRTAQHDVVAEAVRLWKRAQEAKQEAIRELLARREQIDRDLQTLGYVPPAVPRTNGASRATRDSASENTKKPPPASTRFKEMPLASIGRVLLQENQTLHGKQIEEMAKAGGFRGGTRNFQNYLPVAFKRAGGFENIGGNTWRLNDSIQPQR
jgi:hypothetical protein